MIAAFGLKGVILIFCIGLLGFVYWLAQIRGRAARILLLILAQLSVLFPLEIGESIRRIIGARPAGATTVTLQIGTTSLAIRVYLN